MNGGWFRIVAAQIFGTKVIVAAAATNRVNMVLWIDFCSILFMVKIWIRRLLQYLMIQE